jgi:hypothetical protein
VPCTFLAGICANIKSGSRISTAGKLSNKKVTVISY